MGLVPCTATMTPTNTILQKNPKEKELPIIITFYKSLNYCLQKLFDFEPGSLNLVMSGPHLMHGKKHIENIFSMILSTDV